MKNMDDTTSPMAHQINPSQPPSDKIQQDPGLSEEASSLCDKKDQALPKEKSKQNQENERAVTGREKLKKHRREMAGRVWIPEIWGQEDLLKDWIDCTTFDTCLVPKGISSARAALVEEARRAASASVLANKDNVGLERQKPKREESPHAISLPAQRIYSKGGELDKIKGTTDYGINFVQDTDFTLRAYSDSDWAGCPHTRRSTGRFCTFLGSNIISWSSKKQPTVSRSSTEAEYRSLSETASEISWICSVMREIGVPLLITPELYCDNLSSVHLSANPAYHKRSKHFELDYHYVRERVALGALVVRHVPAYLQLADIFTKSLPYAAFDDLRFKLGISTPPTPSLRGTITQSDQNDAVLANKDNVGLEKQKPKREESPHAISLPAQRIYSKGGEVDKIKRQKVTQSSRSVNGLSLYNKFTALDLLND